ARSTFTSGGSEPSWATTCPSKLCGEQVTSSGPPSKPMGNKPGSVVEARHRDIHRLPVGGRTGGFGRSGGAGARGPLRARGGAVGGRAGCGDRRRAEEAPGRDS